MNIVPFKWIECCFRYIITRHPYTPYSIYLRGTVTLNLSHGDDRGGGYKLAG